MRERLKVVIADDEELICSMLQKIIHFEELGLEYAGCAYNGEQLFDLIQKVEPDIVITDINMPKASGLDVTKNVRFTETTCKFIIISGYRNFDYVYEALKCDVADFLLKPINADELNNSLRKIKKSFLSEQSGDEIRVVRAHFMKSVYKELKTGTLLEEVNSTYGTHFVEDTFRMVFFKLDYTAEANIMFEQLVSLQVKIENLTEQELGSLCSDILFDRKPDGVLGLINYKKIDEEQLDEALQMLLKKIQSVLDLFIGLHISICVSGEADLFTLGDAYEQAFDTSWLRMADGLGKVLRWEEFGRREISDTYRQKVIELAKNIRTSYQVLNLPDMQKYIRELFLIPRIVLSTWEVRRVIKGIRLQFFDDNKSLIEQFADVDIMKAEYSLNLMMAPTFQQYGERFEQKLSDIVKEILSYTDKKQTKVIRQAVNYIECNYGRHIGLTEVADAVGLSTAYFSIVFKKEMGQNLIEYLTDYRMKQAKELLKDSTLNINEISDRVGYPDSRYFSKLFKKCIGITPSEFRKLYD
ncbi:MAG: response regulator [Hungatella hathewayi]|uniref:response regulator transcription factor n=1 Tax=Hungatella TaxID=1649459 RepID=UPI00148696EC|nr:MULTISPECIES: response regulator [Hungatella]MCI7380827.1 response regulator [Hungatella sp.]MDY6235822.1 response regulator [Hungatella hathewayi]